MMITKNRHLVYDTTTKKKVTMKILMTLALVRRGVKREVTPIV